MAFRVILSRCLMIGIGPAEVGGGGLHVLQALMATLVASVESRSEHPIAQSTVAVAKAEGLSTLRPKPLRRHWNMACPPRVEGDRLMWVPTVLWRQ